MYKSIIGKFTNNVLLNKSINLSPARQFTQHISPYATLEKRFRIFLSNLGASEVEGVYINNVASAKYPLAGVTYQLDSESIVNALKIEFHVEDGDLINRLKGQEIINKNFLSTLNPLSVEPIITLPQNIEYQEEKKIREAITTAAYEYYKNKKSTQIISR